MVFGKSIMKMENQKVFRIKKIPLILTFLMITASHASAEIEGSMNCKVKSNKFITIDEGITKEYEGFKNGLLVGDMLTLKYEAFLDVIQLTLNNLEGSILPNPFMARLAYNDYGTNKDNKVYAHSGGYGISTPAEYKIYIGPNYISSKFMGVLNGVTSEEYLDLNRYYKNDWQGMVVKTNGLNAHVYTLDCRHTDDAFDSIIDKMKKHLTRYNKVKTKKSPYLSYKDINALLNIEYDELAKQLDEATKRIAELEAAQE